MRILPAYWIFMALFASATAEPRPPLYLPQLRGVISDKLYGLREPNCTQPQPTPNLQFFTIPEHPGVVYEVELDGPAPILPLDCENIPPKPAIDPCLSVNTSPIDHNALAVKNLFLNGRLGAKHAALEKMGHSAPPKLPCAPIVLEKPKEPCLPPPIISLPPPKPIDVIVKPPKIPVVPHRYSYKQVNQDGSLTSWTSYLDINDGVQVTEQGKTLPFFINRLQKLPVHLPVPVLPAVSNIVIPKPMEVSFGSYPAGVRPPSSYSYKQVNQDGKLTTYNGSPSANNIYGGPVIVTENEKMPLPLPALTVDVPVFNGPSFARPLTAPAPGGYSYTQIHSGDGKAFSSASGTTNNFGHFEKPTSLPSSMGYSYSQVSGDKTTKYSGSGVEKYAGVNLTAPGTYGYGAQHVPGSYKMSPVSNSFSYKQVGNGKMTTYTGAETLEETFGESPAVSSQTANYPVRPPFPTEPLVDQFSVPVPSNFVQVPPVYTSAPQRPLIVPSVQNMSPFIYKHVHNDGSVTSYNGDGSMTETGKKEVPMPAAPVAQIYNRLAESPENLGLIPVENNPNAVKPSSTVSGAYSYKLVNNYGGLKINDYNGNNDHSANNQPSAKSTSGESYVDSNIQGSYIPSPSAQTTSGPSYSYKQIKNNKFDLYSGDNSEDLVMEEKLSSEQYSSMAPNASDDQDLNRYLYVPPPMGIAPTPQPAKYTVPQSTYSYKHTTNSGLYEYSNKLDPTEGTTSQATVKSRRRPAPNVYIDDKSLVSSTKQPATNIYIDDMSQISSTQNPVVSDRDSLANNPIVVAERSSFSFKNTNADGSTITVKDDGNNSVSVQLKEAVKPAAIQEESPKSEVTQEVVTRRTFSRRIKESTPAGKTSNLVIKKAKALSKPVTPSYTPAKPWKRRKVVKRVKTVQRGDIPEDE